MAEAKKQEVPAVKSGAEVINWQAELNALTVATAEAEKPSGNWISFKGGVLTIGGNPMKGNRVEAIILHAVFENQWYKEKYDPTNPTSPHCYAIGETEDDLKPHPNALAPQNDTCAGCPKNEWKSDPNGGKGKACKNVRRLAMIAAPDASTPEGVQKAEVAVAKLPVTSVKNWSTYASQIASVLKLPPLAVRTEMLLEPDAKTQYQVNFLLVDKIEDGAIIQALLNKRRETTDMIMTGYDKPTEATATQRKF